MSFISVLFRRNIEPPFDIEKAVGKYLLNLPRCSRDVLIVSPKYGETDYTCEIIVAAEKLAPWAEHHADAVWSSNQETQVARKALPLWLNSAKSEDDSVSYVPHYMYEVLRPYVSNFVGDGAAKIYCLKCQSFVIDVKMEKFNQIHTRVWWCWTDVWTCPLGHRLYYEEHNIHLCY